MDTDFSEPFWIGNLVSIQQGYGPEKLLQEIWTIFGGFHPKITDNRKPNRHKHQKTPYCHTISWCQTKSDSESLKKKT